MMCNSAFFGLDKLPEINIDEDILKKLAEQSIRSGITVTGVQKKLSLHLSGDEQFKLTIIGFPAGYILKPQTEQYPQLPEAEDMVMDIAEMMGIRTVPHGLIETNAGLAYITKRVDRDEQHKYAMEDFCQLTGRLTQDKYSGSYEQCGKVISKYSSLPGFDLSEFFLRLVVCFLCGNSDMHLKNFSLLESYPGNREFVLSPAYDLLPVNLIIPEDDEETALMLNGKKKNIHRKDFLIFADRIGLNQKAAQKIISLALSKKEKTISLCMDSYLHEDLKKEFIDMFTMRCERLY